MGTISLLATDALDIYNRVYDFELALISSVQTQLSDADVVGCLFHWKQVNLRNMRRLHIPTQEASIAMTRGVLDVLTVLEQDTIDPRGTVWGKD